MKKLSFSRLTTPGFAVVVSLIVGLAPTTQGNKVYTYDPNTSKITEACFATLEVDCLVCTSTECPVPDHGGTDLVQKLTIYDIAPSGCAEFALQGEKPFIVYNYLNIWGSEHYWYRDENGDWQDSYFWQYGHCIAAKEGESHRNLTWRIYKAPSDLKSAFDDEIEDAWAGYHSDLADALSDANRNALIGMGASIAAGGGSTYWIAVSAICYDYYDATRDAKNELFDECDDANADFSEAVKNLR